MREIRRFRLRRAALASLAVVGVVCVAALPTSAGPEGMARRRVVENPGRFWGTAQPGSIYEYVDDAGNPIYLAEFDVGNPACDDDLDDDVDGYSDFEQDPECDSPEDANERLDGVQEFTPAALPMKIKANGVITVRPRDLVVTPREKCVDYGDEVWCLLISPTGTGPARRGSIAADGTVTVPIPLVIKIDALVGYPGFDPRCKIGYTENLHTATDYDEATGEVSLETGAENPAPAAVNCGQYTELLNSVLGLPGNAHSILKVEVLDADGNPVELVG